MTFSCSSRSCFDLLRLTKDERGAAGGSGWAAAVGFIFTREAQEPPVEELTTGEGLAMGTLAVIQPAGPIRFVPCRTACTDDL